MQVYVKLPPASTSVRKPRTVKPCGRLYTACRTVRDTLVYTGLILVVWYVSCCL